MENEIDNPQNENLEEQYEQGTDIHVGPGQEQHLPHEAWHEVSQRQGRVRPIRMEGEEGDDEKE